MMAGSVLKGYLGREISGTCGSVDEGDHALRVPSFKMRQREIPDLKSAHYGGGGMAMKLRDGKLMGNLFKQLENYKPVNLLQVPMIHSLSFGRTEHVNMSLLDTQSSAEAVRDLAIMPPYGVLSASDDCCIRLWSLTSQEVKLMIGHTSVVYSVDSHSSGLVASGGADCFLKIWKDGACVQSIEHPGWVWDAKFMENGDILTACSDSIVRIWTPHNARMADPGQLEAYELGISQTRFIRKRFCLDMETPIGPGEHQNSVSARHEMAGEQSLKRKVKGLLRCLSLTRDILSNAYHVQAGGIPLDNVVNEQIQVPVRPVINQAQLGGCLDHQSLMPTEQADCENTRDTTSVPADPDETEEMLDLKLPNLGKSEAPSDLTEPEGHKGPSNQKTTGATTFTMFEKRYKDITGNMVPLMIEYVRDQQAKAALKTKVEARQLFLLGLPIAEVHNLCLSLTLKNLEDACADAKEFRQMLDKARTFYRSNNRFDSLRCFICDPNEEVKSHRFWSAYSKTIYETVKSYIGHVFHEHFIDPNLKPGPLFEEVLDVLAGVFPDDMEIDSVELYFLETISGLICNSPQSKEFPSVDRLAEWLYLHPYSENAFFRKANEGYKSFLALSCQIYQLCELKDYEFRDLNSGNYHSTLLLANRNCQAAINASIVDIRTAFLPLVQSHLRDRVERLMKRKANALAEELLREESHEKSKNKGKEKIGDVKKQLPPEELTKAEEAFLKQLGWDIDRLEPELTQDEINNFYAENPGFKRY